MRFILTFHHLSNRRSPLSFPPTGLPCLLDALVEAEFPILNLDALLAPDCERGVALTFDDGICSIMEHARPVLLARRLPAHLFLVTGHVGGVNRWPSQPRDAPVLPLVDWGDVEQLCHAGWHIDAHTHDHPDLRTIPVEVAVGDCARADEEIERRLGRRPRYFAYPYGGFTRELETRLAPRYEAMLTTELRFLDRRRDRRTALPRLDTHYFRPSWLQRRPVGGAARTYLELRGWLRSLRGWGAAA
jgi:peptidoglycan/xylan/chitin deacetylase (PgdA/CDA1 family)